MDLDLLRANFKGDLVLPSDACYKKAIARWAVNAERNAGIVAYVRDAEDAAAAILYAKAHKLDLAIRGGGHHVSGASSSDDGLVIDLSRHLNAVKVNPEQRLAYVGGGALLEAVDTAAIEHGLATVVGTVNHTGVGGLTLGGGFGFQSPAHGLAIDNLVQVTVVTADGSILTANDTENPDLFWAIRGSGSNFGVVTEFVLRLHPQRATVFGGMLFFPPSRVPKVASAIDDWWNSDPSEKEALFQVISRTPDDHPFIGVLLFYNGSEQEGKDNFKAFFDLEPIKDTCAEIPYETLNSLNNPMTMHGQNRYHKSVFIISSQMDATPKVFDHLQKLNEESSDVHFTMFHEYFPGKKVAAIPADAMAFFHRATTCHAICLATWSQNTPKNLQAAREGITELLKITAGPQNASVKLGYGNYTGDVDPSASRAVFGDNYPRLQKLKQKYDPDLIFNKWFLIKPTE